MDSTRIEKKLLKLANKVLRNAYVPWSGHRVGAAVLTKSGRYFLGCNIESAFYPTNPPGICAERVAISSAYSAGDQEIVAIAIVGETTEPIKPCTVCRKVIKELAPNCTIICSNLKGDICVFSNDTFS